MSIVHGSLIYDDYLQSVKFIFPSPYRFLPPPICTVCSWMKRGWLVWRSPKHGRLVSTRANNNYSPGLTRKEGMVSHRDARTLTSSTKAEFSTLSCIFPILYPARYSPFPPLDILFCDCQIFSINKIRF